MIKCTNQCWGAWTFYREMKPEPELVKNYRDPEPLNLI